MAQAPTRDAHLADMASAIDMIDGLIETGIVNDAAIRKMQAANRQLHSTILKACGNDYVGYTCEKISHLPMLAVGSMVFDRAVFEEPGQCERGLFRLRLGNAQHKVIYEATRT